MQQLIINVRDPGDLLNGFGAGALIRVERDTTSTMATSSERTVIALVDGQTQYEWWDSSGARTHYYRTRYSTATPSLSTDYSDYSDVFQVGQGPLEYVTEALLKAQVSINDTVDDTLLSVICGRVNQYIESTTKQPVGPIASATYLYDVSYLGHEYHHHRWPTSNYGYGPSRLFLPTPVDAATMGIGGLRSVSLVEFASYTGADFATVSSTDYFLRDRAGVIGPYRYLCLSDHLAGLFTHFPVGRGTVRVTGTAGWASIPDDLTGMALELAKRAWYGRASNPTDDQGLPAIAPFVSGPDRATLRNYTLKLPAVPA